MSHTRRTVAAIVVMASVILGGCSGDVGTRENQESESLAASRGEDDRAGREQGEESGTELALSESYDEVRYGARLVLAYDAQSRSFEGTVENTSNETLRRVRVEVHLSNGRELGPTTPSDLGPGDKREVTLTATSQDFDGWTAHAEVGSAEHGGGEGQSEHSEGEEQGEHGGSEERGEHR